MKFWIIKIYFYALRYNIYSLSTYDEEQPYLMRAHNFMILKTE